jgi:hypothetical protein
MTYRFQRRGSTIIAIDLASLAEPLINCKQYIIGVLDLLSLSLAADVLKRCAM